MNSPQVGFSYTQRAEKRPPATFVFHVLFELIILNPTFSLKRKERAFES